MRPIHRRIPGPDDRRPATVRVIPRVARPARETPADAERLIADLGALISGVTLATNDLGRVIGRVRDSLHDVSDAMGEAWSLTREHGGGVAEFVDDTLRNRPYVAVALAAAVGLLVAYAVRQGLAAREAGGLAPDERWDHADGWDHFV